MTKMVHIPRATVRLGSPPEVLDAIADSQHYPRSWFEDEEPCIPIEVAGFYIDRFLVTNRDFAEFVGSTGYRTIAEDRGFGLIYGDEFWEEVEGACWNLPGGSATSIDDRLDHPVVHIAHADATAYAEWSGKRLPTEFEWEYAARGERFKWWPWGNEWDRRRAITAEYWSHREMAGLNSWRSWWVGYLRQFGPVPDTAPVGSLGPEATSPFGIHDMAGNVLEWTSSRYKLYADDREYDEIYRFIEGRYLVLRGGSWMNLRYQVRCAERIPTDGTGYSTFAVGFRCARDA